MLAPYAFRGLRVLVVGLGRFGGGVGVTRWLAGQGAKVTVTDQADPESLSESLRRIADLQVTLRLGGHDPDDLNCTDLVVINPAVDKARSDFFQEIAGRGIPWTTETNLFCERCPARVMAVTGSYGKSTTAAMLHHALVSGRTAGPEAAARIREVHLGGNIGLSLLGALSDIQPEDVVVLEISNAQLEDVPRIEWTPWLAVITNLHPHHIERHGTFEVYAAAKLNVLGSRGLPDALFVGDLDPRAESWLMDRVGDRRNVVTRVSFDGPAVPLRVAGTHNQRNAAMVSAVCQWLGFAETETRAALGTFQGLPHRLALVREVGGVRYVNDSKSTSPAATVMAMEALAGPLVLILGGQRKSGIDMGVMARLAATRCRAVICTGECASDFTDAIRLAMAAAPDETNRESASPEPRASARANPGTPEPRDSVNTHPRSGEPRASARADVPPPTHVANPGTSPTIEQVADLPAAVAAAVELARPGDTVLFSPGAPSFDAYVNYEQRGRHFQELVERLQT